MRASYSDLWNPRFDSFGLNVGKARQMLTDMT
jgi:hypothetical protein